MEMEIPEAGSKKLNNLIALTVLIVSVVMGMAKIKDDNIVQSMQQYKSDIVDTWNEYQAKSVKLHIDEQTILLSQPIVNQLDSTAQRQLSDIKFEAMHYRQKLPTYQAQAKIKQAAFDVLSYRDDQFDLGDALLSIGLALAGIAALLGERRLLAVCWVFSLGGIAFVVAGFAGLPLHPDAIVSLLT